MPRSPRVEDATAAHHVVARSPSGRKLFYDDQDYSRYLDVIARELRERTWRLFTYCLMPNHVHLLLATPQCDLGRGIQRAHGEFARYLNGRYECHGHVFGGRFHNRRVTSDRHFIACLRYIARNPVAAGLAETAADWPWSAHRALAGLEPNRRLLFADEARAILGTPRPKQAYAELVARSDTNLMTALRDASLGDEWLLEAVEHPDLTLDVLARFMCLDRSTVARRLTAAQRARGDSPPRRRAQKGTVPIWAGRARRARGALPSLRRH